MSNIDKAIRKQQRIALTVKVPLIVLSSVLLITALIYILFVKGYVFKVSPQEATPASFTLNQGLGFFIGNKLYTLSADNSVTVSAPTYASDTVELNNDTQKNAASVVEITLTPLPANVRLSTQFADTPIAWRIDDELIDVSPIFEKQLPPGEVAIQLNSAFHEPKNIRLTLERAQTVDQVVELVPVKGLISISSTPDNAQVLIDDEVIGNTPLSVPKEGGKHTIELRLAGYQSVTDSISITQMHKTAEREYNLIPLQALLTVELIPTGGALLVNGKPALSPVSVNANELHNLKYEKPGYITQTRTISLAPNENKNMLFKLKPETTVVELDANEIANVRINGKPVGRTPMSVSMQTIATRIAFSKPGYRSVEKTFTPKVNQPNRLEATMLTEFAARRAEGRPLVAQQFGIDMQRIEGQSFIMGSPANEPFRYRNEQAMRVNFTRPFYMSTKEITEAQYAQFKQGYVSSNLPVTNISWLEAAAFCNWLSEQEGLSPFYDLLNGTINEESGGYRLPTEAEWEFVASRYKQYTRFKYFWGNEERLRKQQGNFADKSLNGVQPFFFEEYEDGYTGKAPVGSFKPRSGMYDIDGNVAEWVHDRYSLRQPLSLTNNTGLSDDVMTDYLGPPEGVGNVVKGGSYKSGRLRDLRNALRKQGVEPANDIGFRIARYASDTDT